MWHATAGLALPVLDQRRADPGDLLISLGLLAAIPQINHHKSLCFVIRAKQGDNPARTRLAAPVLSAINQPAGSTERINGPATRSSTIHCNSCRWVNGRSDAGWSAAAQVAAMLAGVVMSAGVAGKRLIQFRFPAVKAGDVVADLAQKRSQSCGAADGGQQQIGGAVIAHGNGGGTEFSPSCRRQGVFR